VKRGDPDATARSSGWRAWSTYTGGSGPVVGEVELALSIPGAVQLGTDFQDLAQMPQRLLPVRRADLARCASIALEA
jgi:hypothetical protein